MPSSEATLRGRIGAFSLHAQRDSREITKAARRAFLGKFLQEVDPEHILSDDERLRRAAAARSAHFAKLALKSVQARRRKAGRQNGAAT